ncbi:MAG TPA: AzlC family ABC transporter permease [Anaerolineae bacterium]|nr:AzlC family ABC transporter permease [Anaerolineae bacterium]
MPTSRSEFFAGIKGELPLLLGVMPYGMIYGVLALKAGLPADIAQAMSFIVFAGSSQLIGTPLIAGGSPVVVIVLTTFVVNLRHMLYSASMAPYIKHLPARWKWLLAYLLTDEAYAVTIARYTRPEAVPSSNKRWYYFGAGLTLWSSWQLSTLIGIQVGQLIPDSWSLDFTLALTFIALVVPRLKDRASTAAAMAASLVAIIGFALPYKLGLMTAALIGIVAGMIIEARLSSSLVARQSSESE